MSALMVIVLMGLVTFVPRWLGLRLSGRPVPPFWLRFFRFVPIAVFPALIVPELFARPDETVIRLAPFVIAGFAWFITAQLRDIRTLQAEQTTKLQGVTGDVQVINAKLDSGVIWRISELERRVNTVEQAQKTP